MNLHQKLIEVRKTCQYLKKDNSGYQFNYVSSSQTLGTLRGAMDEHGVLLIPSIVGHDVSEKVNKKGNTEFFTELNMLFTWVNAETPEEKIECPFYAQGIDNGEKGVGKALTYAEKYFLLKFFNIATDKDDPDSFQQKSEIGRTYNPAQDIANGEACTTKGQLTAWWSALPTVAQGNDKVRSSSVKIAARIDAQNKPEPLTDDQRIAIQAHYNGVDRNERLKLISEFVGREIKSVNDLTKTESTKLIDHNNKG